MTRRLVTTQFDALPLFATDAELAAAIMGPARAGQWGQVVAYYEGKGLPPVDPVSGARYRPAVRKFFDELWGVNTPGMLPARDGVDHPERWDSRRGGRT